MLVKEAPVLWNTLKGLICVYKPADSSCERVRQTIITKICSELNEMECRPPLEYVNIVGNPSKKLLVKVDTDLADHPLVVGPRYIPDDLPCSWSNFLGRRTSGVLLLGLRSGTKISKYIRENKPSRVYRLSGVLGEMTDNGYMDGKVVEKSTWRHVKLNSIELMLSSMQASHQKKMFENCGVDIQSQLAFELAAQGPIRPANSKIPVIYGIRCVDFSPPNFALEIQCVNENETYLMTLISEIGTKLHSTAHCTGIKCIRHSYFTLDLAMLQKHWTLQNIISNLEECNRILSENRDLVYQDSVALKQIT